LWKFSTGNDVRKKLSSIFLIERKEIFSSNSSSTNLCGKQPQSLAAAGKVFHTPMWTEFHLSTGEFFHLFRLLISTGSFSFSTDPVD
jgi:hypothetical protein